MRFKIAVKSIEEARKQMRKNQKMAAIPMDYRSEIGQPLILNIILDISLSMEDFYGELLGYFNDIMIPTLKEISQRHKRPLRIGCLLFSEKLVPAWKGFKDIRESGAIRLNNSKLEHKGLQRTTALYQAMRSGALWTVAAMEQMYEAGQGEFPKGNVIVLTDGANNEIPTEEKAVRDALDSIGKLNSRNLKTSIIFLNTDDGLIKEQLDEMCQKTGFTLTGSLKIKKSLDQEERIISFRRQIRNLF